MGEAAVKEPSMEDILSSIRKIISEEGADGMPIEASAVQVDTAIEPALVTFEPEVQLETTAPKMSEMLDKVRTTELEPEALVENIVVDNTPSGNQVAVMAASLASLSAVEPEASIETEMVTESVWADTSEPTIEDEPVEVEPQTTAPSLAAIAESVLPEVAVEAEPEIRHVEMAEATAAPEQEIEVEVPAAVSSASVEAMVEEEMAFKGALMSPSADGAVAGAFDRLKRSAMDDVDATTEAILRPMLREWLDENLPNMVERLVREEIERVARGV